MFCFRWVGRGIGSMQRCLLEVRTAVVVLFFLAGLVLWLWGSLVLVWGLGLISWIVNPLCNE